MSLKSSNLIVSGQAFVREAEQPGHFTRVAITIEDGLIREVGPPKAGAEDGVDVFFGDDFWILPGFMDMHVHCREDASGEQSYKEDFETAGKAAGAGGVVAMADMPNNPVPPDTAERYAEKKALSEKAGVDVLLYAAARPGTEPFSRDVPYKVFLNANLGATQDQLEAFFKAYHDCWISVHAEDPDILKDCAHKETHVERRPPSAEVAAVKKLLAALEAEPCVHLHICHVSTREAVKLIGKGKAQGLPVSCEVCCHHLFFDNRTFPGFDPNFRHVNLERWLPFSHVNPPLRRAGDRKALSAGLDDGVIDALATDHAPHLPEEKRAGASGFPGLDVYGAFATLLAKTLPPSRLVSVTSGFAAGFWRRFTGERFGEIAPGAVGSLTVVGPVPWKKVHKKSFCTKCGWSPWAGYTFPGAVEATIVRGAIKYRRKQDLG